MANMSYCRFRNTLSDLVDCYMAMEEIANNGGVDDYGDELSLEEKKAAIKLYDLCREFIDIFEDSPLYDEV